jgi:hypothetical protein
MLLHIPESAHVIINIGNEAVRTLAEERATREPSGRLHRPLRPLLMVLIAVVAFGLGHIVRFGHEGAGSGAAPALAAAPLSSQQMPASHPSSAETEIPPAFSQGLNQPPQVTPPPGYSTTPAPTKNPFGLEN